MTTPSNSKLSVVWTNNAEFTRPMSRHRVSFRPEGLTCRRLHLDQVYIMFRPTTNIPDDAFVGTDSKLKSWYAETQHLLVRTRPGVVNTLFTVDPNTPAHTETVSQPDRSVAYSGALTAVPTTASTGTEANFWCRAFRPVRDLPVAVDLDGVHELDIELFFPLLFGNDVTDFVPSVPNYRILKIYLELSVDR